MAGKRRKRIFKDRVTATLDAKIQTHIVTHHDMALHSIILYVLDNQDGYRIWVNDHADKPDDMLSEREIEVVLTDIHRWIDVVMSTRPLRVLPPDLL